MVIHFGQNGAVMIRVDSVGRLNYLLLRERSARIGNLLRERSARIGNLWVMNIRETAIIVLMSTLVAVTILVGMYIMFNHQTTTLRDQIGELKNNDLMVVRNLQKLAGFHQIELTESSGLSNEAISSISYFSSLSDLSSYLSSFVDLFFEETQQHYEFAKYRDGMIEIIPEKSELANEDLMNEYKKSMSSVVREYEDVGSINNSPKKWEALLGNHLIRKGEEGMPIYFTVIKTPEDTIIMDPIYSHTNIGFEPQIEGPVVVEDLILSYMKRQTLVGDSTR